MSLMERYAAERDARLVRLGVRAKPRFVGIDPAPFYRQMWMWNLVSPTGEPAQPTLSLAEITDSVCEYFRVQKRELLSIRMTADLVYPRQVCYFMARSHTNASSNRVGKYFSRDHATVLHGAKKIRRQIWEDWRVAYDIANLEAML